MNKIERKNLAANHDGFGLIGTMMAFGLASILWLWLMEAMIKTQKISNTSDANQEMNEIENEGNRTLSSDLQCTQSLRGQAVLQDLVIFDPFKTERRLLWAGLKYKKFWEVEAVRFENMESVDGVPGLKRANVVVNYRRSPGLTYGRLVFKKQLRRVFIRTTIANNIEVVDQCLGSYESRSTAASTCRLMGGEWSDDESLSTAERCNLEDVVAQRVIRFYEQYPDFHQRLAEIRQQLEDRRIAREASKQNRRN